MSNGQNPISIIMPSRRIHTTERSSAPAYALDDARVSDSVKLYCREKAGGSGSTFYYRTLFLPSEVQATLSALYAFRREVEDVVDECADVGLARLKLDWWRQEMASTFAHKPRHPVTQALAPTITRYQLPLENFLDLIEGVTMRLGSFRFRTFDELAVFCRRTGARIESMAAEILNPGRPETRAYADDLGIALELTNLIRDQGTEARRNRIYIPEEELERFGVTRDSILRRAPRGDFPALIEYQVERAERFHAQALNRLAGPDRSPQLPGLIAAAISRATLAEIRLDGFRVLEHKLALTPLRKFWIAWTTRWRERRRARRYPDS